MTHCRYLIPLFLLFSFISSAVADDKTTVRVQGSPQGTFEKRGNATHITHVEATARNVGSTAATGVRVSARLPGGQSIDLSGPSDLAPNKTGVYTTDVFRVGDERKKPLRLGKLRKLPVAGTHAVS